MAWQYSDWASSQYTTAQKQQRLADHIAEVSEGAGGASISSGSNSRDPHSVTEYLKLLQDQVDKLARLPDAAGAVNGGQSLASTAYPRCRG